jgi:microcystin-dependent protein
MAYSKKQLEAITGNVPIGTIVPYGGASAPGGYLMCNGAAISRATYADLFAAISTTYGSGDGSTTFNLPNLQQKFPLGKASSGTGSTLGSSGGTIDHQHQHISPLGISSGSLMGILPSNTSMDYNGSSYDLLNIPGTTDGYYIVDSGPATWERWIVTSTANNPPYQVVNYIIRYASGAVGASPVRNQTPSGTIDGGNATFTLANTPLSNTLEVYLNGIRQRSGASNDYTLSGTTLTFVTAPPVNSIILVDYFV